MSNIINGLNGAFLTNYQIGEGLDGGIDCNLSLVIVPSLESANGGALVTQSTNPPLRIPSAVAGNLIYMFTMTSGHVRIDLTGTGFVAGQVRKNFELQMVLDSDFQHGVANYSFYDGKEWVQLRNQPVKAVENPVINNFSELAEAAKAANS